MNLRLTISLLLPAVFILMLVACGDSQPLNDNTNQYERALQDLDEAIRLNPQAADAYYNRGMAYTLIGKPIKAGQDFAKAEELGYDP